MLRIRKKINLLSMVFCCLFLISILLNHTNVQAYNTVADVSQTEQLKEHMAEKARINTRPRMGEQILKLTDKYAVEIEAEDISGDKKIIYDEKECSNSKYVEYKLDATLTDPMRYGEPAAVFSINAEKKAKYVLWARVYSEDSNSNGLYTAVNDDSYNAVYNRKYGSWNWVKLSTRMMQEGVHTYYIIPRSLNVKIDKFIVSNTAVFTPTELGNITEKIKKNVVYPKPTFVPPAEHPRVYFRKQHIPQIKENMLAEENKAAYASFKSNVETPVDTFENRSPSSQMLTVIESKALNYALNGTENSGKEAIEILFNIMDELNISLYTDYGQREFIGQYMSTCGMLYDWCYDLLSEDEKEIIYNEVIACASHSEIGYPPTKLSGVFTHGNENQLQRDLLIPAIALYDEYPDIYYNVAGRIFQEYIEPKIFLNEGEWFPPGTHYTFRIGFELLCVFLFDRMGYPNVYGDGYSKMLQSYLYMSRPDGHILYEGDAPKRGASSFYIPGGKAMELAASYFKDPYLKFQAMRANSSLTTTEKLLLRDPTVIARPISELPLSKYLPGHKGGLICRTGWEDGIESNNVVAEMHINVYNFAEHQQYDSGSFQIYYKGYLATDAGYYQAVSQPYENGLMNDGNTHCDGLYMNNYGRRTIAHNSMLVYDPDEVFTRNLSSIPTVNDGGQKAPVLWTGGKTLEFFFDEDNGYRVGHVLGHEIGEDQMQPNYSYLKGDLSKAYSDKVENYERSFMFLNLKNDENPAALIVFDRVISSNSAFKKTWLCHGLEEPEIIGNRTTFKDTRDGYNGKLTIDTLLPTNDNLVIEKVGGLDTDSSSVAIVGDKTFLANLDPTLKNEGGGWRIEVSPQNEEKCDYFLNVLQVGDADKDNALEVSKIETDKVAGAVIADRVAVFGKTADRIESEFEFEFAGNKEYEITVAGVKEGTWIVTRNCQYICDAVASEEGGLLCFRGESGNYVFQYKSPL